MRDVINARMAELAAQFQEEHVAHHQGSSSHDPDASSYDPDTIPHGSRHLSEQSIGDKHYKQRSRSPPCSYDAPLDKRLVGDSSHNFSHDVKHPSRHDRHKPRSHKQHKSRSRSRDRYKSHSHDNKHKHKHKHKHNI